MPRRDNDLLDITSIVPDTDGRATDNHASRPPSRSPKRSANSTSAPATTALAKQLIIFLLLLALSLVCGYFYFMALQQKTLNDQLQNRLATVESQLGMTTETQTHSSQTLGEKIKSIDEKSKLNEDEIKKLWAITNDKNKKILDAHTMQISEQDKSLTAIQSSLSEIRKSLALVEKASGEANRLGVGAEKSASDAAAAIVDMRSAVGALQQRLAQGDPLVREASQQAAMAQEQSDRLQSKLESIDKRVADHDESLKSIDSFRRSVNSDLGRLKQQSMSPSPVPIQ